MTDIVRFQKEARDIIVTVKDDSGTPIDITGDTFYFTVKEQYDDDATDAASIISKSVSVVSGTTGQTQFTITENDTSIEPKTYFYDVWRKVSTGSQYVIKQGKFLVRKTATNRV
jgi:hypothetical protein